MRASNSEIPPELRRKIAPAPLLFKAGERVFITVVFTGFAGLCLLGPPVLRNGFVFLLGLGFVQAFLLSFFRCCRRSHLVGPFCQEIGAELTELTPSSCA